MLYCVRMVRIARFMILGLLLLVLAGYAFAYNVGGVVFAPKFSPVHKSMQIYKQLPEDFNANERQRTVDAYKLKQINDKRNFGYVNYFDPVPYEKFSRSHLFNTRFGGEKNNFKRPTWVGKRTNPWTFSSPFYSRGVGMVKHDVAYTASFSRYGHYGKRLM